ncbi:hypothetical protein HY407_02430 [Candidatus Gottesmanbacteria bacterium]|nr:hypothetical protein [Candidatus Gottesmanbacteria bacterium]
MNKILAGITVLLLLVSVAIVTPGTVSAQKWINVIPGTELFGCVPEKLATHLLSSGGFSSIGSPVVILCSEGYTAVYRVLP